MISKTHKRSIISLSTYVHACALFLFGKLEENTSLVLGFSFLLSHDSFSFHFLFFIFLFDYYYFIDIYISL